jgi:hypothetical protein
MQEHVGIHRLALCAVGLSFEHPFTGEALNIRCGLDESLLGIERMINEYMTWQAEDFDIKTLI